ncbi:MAG: hypothetical protein K0B87_08810 [Candidatus Syntrophosphaera sp.]|nr:hypothetical protein [Candidatus Syntrophosphaera sp.]
MRIALKCLLIGLALIGLSSCKLFKTPTLEKVHDVKVLSIDPDKTNLEVSISVNNSNCYTLILKELEVNLLNRTRERIGSVELKKAVEIPKKRSNALDFHISLDTRPTVKMVNHSDQKVFVYISGEGSGKVLGVSKKFSFEEPYEIDIKEQLEKVVSGFKADGQDIFQIKRSYVKQVRLAQSQIAVDFLILNPYGLQFKLKSFPSTISIGGREAGTGEILQPLEFDERVYSREGSMTFKINNWKAIVNAVKGAFKGEIEYEVNGKVKIDAYGLEIDQPFTYGDLIYINVSELIF